MSSSIKGVGIDGCRAGWLAVAFDGQDAEMILCESVADVQDFAGSTPVIYVDMPIGFLDGGAVGRTCDQLARRILSPIRHSSVFTPPCRAALYADKLDASAINFSQTGKKLSQQSLNILPKMKALDAYLQSCPPSQQARWMEAHPEVVFAVLNGGTPIAAGKKQRAGAEMRKALLRKWFAGLDDWWLTQANRYKRADVQPDDMLDALVLAIASHLTQTAQAVQCHLPDVVELDSTGLRMQLVYAKPL